MDDVEAVREAVKGKRGPELFKELLRHYPLLSLDDYYRHGIWQDDTMKLDIQILAAHRLEAGAPDPIPLAEVKMQDVPPPPPKPFMPSLLLPGLPGSVRPPQPPLASSLRPVGLPAAAQSVLAAGAAGGAAGGASSTAAAAAAAAVDLRQLALFVSKWQLDPARANSLLAELSPERRLFVLQTFKSSGGASAPEAQLEEYLTQCEQRGLWPPPSSPSGGAAAAAPAVLAAAGGVRPPALALAAAAAVNPLKRGLLDGVTAPAVATAAAMAAAAAATAPGAGPREVRPRLAAVVAPPPGLAPLPGGGGGCLQAARPAAAR